MDDDGYGLDAGQMIEADMRERVGLRHVVARTGSNNIFGDKAYAEFKEDYLGMVSAAVNGDQTTFGSDLGEPIYAHEGVRDEPDGDLSGPPASIVPHKRSAGRKKKNVKKT